jgi:hypothetical protein
VNQGVFNFQNLDLEGGLERVYYKEGKQLGEISPRTIFTGAALARPVQDIVSCSLFLDFHSCNVTIQDPQ